MTPSTPDSALVDAMRRALAADDAVAMQTLLTSRPEGRAAVNEPIAAFEAPPIVHVRSRAMLDVLIDAGADINARSRWWAGSFGLLDSASADLATYAIGRGALLTVHAAARLGWMTELSRLVEAEPELIGARGGDGQTPLHFAGTIEAAVYLIEHGADIDALDIDHESTPAQYMTGERQLIARELLLRGCRVELMLAAAVGDARHAERILDETPEAIRMRVDGEWFPKRNPHAGGTIYQWTLGFHASPHQVARTRGHTAVIDLLTARSPADVALTEACWAGDELAVREIVARHPSATRSLRPSAQTLLAHAARNNQTVTVRLMVETGWLVDARGQHGATALHWASYHGNVPMVEALLGAAAPIDLRDRDFDGTPIGWAIHGSEQGWYAVSGDYRGTVERLLRAGARPDAVGGSADVREVLRSFTA